MRKSSVKDAVIAVTYQCNSRCRMCNIWQIKDSIPGLKPGDFLTLPATLESINISGGEPFLRGDLPEIIQVIKRKCPRAKIVISSNGFATNLITSAMQKIKSIDSDVGAAVSLDGIGKAHNEIRGVEGGYEKVLRTIANLKRLGIKHLKIGFTLGDYNAEELPKVYSLADKLETEFSLAIVHSSENYFSKENPIENKRMMIRQLEWLIHKELSSWNIKKWGRAYFAYGAGEFLKTGKRILPDYSGKLNIFIDPMGNVFPCDVSNKKTGILRNFKDIDFKTSDKKCSSSWMVCTARQSIKKHWLKTCMWILKNKLCIILRSEQSV